MRLITADAVLGHPAADAVLIDGDRVNDIGEAVTLRAPGQEEVSFPGGVLMPGLADSHLHPGGYAAAVTGMSLKSSADLGEVLARLAARAADLPPRLPLIGIGLDDTGLAEGRLPTRADLDIFERPVLVYRYCAHVAVANTAALTAAGITPATTDPAGGTLDRDPGGHLTGVLRETAISLVATPLEAFVPTPPPDRLLACLAGLTSFGIVRVDAMVSAGAPLWCGSGLELDDLVQIAPDLPLDVGVFVIADTPSALELAADRLRHAARQIRFLGWKGFADGSLGGHTAALSEPYADRPWLTGVLRTGHLPIMAGAALALGGTATIHAIGDAANTAVLDLYEQLADAGGDPARLRVEHASVLSPDLIERFARSGVTASVQPAFLTSEQGWLPTRIGRDRTRWTYPLRSLDDAGVPLVAGSDAPVESPDPWPAIAASRRHPTCPDESLTAERSLAIFTADSLAVGGPADLLVVDRHPLTAETVAWTEVWAVWKDGVRVIAPAFPWPG